MTNIIPRKNLNIKNRIMAGGRFPEDIIKKIKLTDELILNNYKASIAPHPHKDTFSLEISEGFLVVNRLDYSGGWGWHHKAIFTLS